jgi:hypothetical protein
VIPAFTLSGVLPPFDGPNPGQGSISPYRATLLEVAQRLCTSRQRIGLLRGLIELRKALVKLGINQAVQWLDGSFCENVEISRGRPPADIDVVTLFIRPEIFLKEPAKWKTFVEANRDVFSRERTKKLFCCDAFFVDIQGLSISNLIQQITYWHGLFTHQRETFQWKGIIEVQLTPNDDDVVAYLDAAETML